MAENSRQKYLDFLKKEIEKYCNNEGYYEVYVDYRDEISPDDILSYYDSYQEDKEGYTSFKDYLDYKIFDEYYLDYDSNFFDSIRTDVYQTDDKEIIDQYFETDNLYEDLEECGYNGVAFDIVDLLSNTNIYVNIMFATDKEQNYDMSSIASAYGNDWQSPFEYFAYNEDEYDNAFTYLIHQQGHTVKEVLEGCYAHPKGFLETNDFVDSVVNEIVNNPSEMCELTALVRLRGQQIVDFIDRKENGKGYLEFDKDTEIGLFNEWNGGGSLLEITLEKPFIVPVSMIRDFQIEGAKNQYYSVDSVYGLVGSCWKDSLSYSHEAPDLVQEDIAKTVSEVEEAIKSQDEEMDKE